MGKNIIFRLKGLKNNINDESVLNDSGIYKSLNDGFIVEPVDNDLGQMEFFSAYLVSVGIRSHEFTYKDNVLFNNIDYFKKCYNDGISPYIALTLFYDYLNYEK